MDTNIRGIGTEYRRKLAAAMSGSPGILTSRSVADSLNIANQEACRILSRWNSCGWVKRLKSGIYMPIELDDTTGELTIEDPWILIDTLFSPGYIGGFSAIKYWDFSEQLFETTTYITTKPVKDKQPIIGSSQFNLKNIRAFKLFATKNVWRDNVRIPISDPSKTIVDLLDDPTLVGGMRIVLDVFNEYQKSNYYDMQQLITYSEKMRNKTIFKRLGFMLETIGQDNIIKQFKLNERISKGYSNFDPLMDNTKIVRCWNLRIPTSWT